MNADRKSFLSTERISVFLVLSFILIFLALFVNFLVCSLFLLLLLFILAKFYVNFFFQKNIAVLYATAGGCLVINDNVYDNLKYNRSFALTCELF